MEPLTKQALETALEAIQDYYKDGNQFYGRKVFLAVDRIKQVLLNEEQKVNSEKSDLPIVIESVCDCAEPDSEDHAGNKWCGKCKKFYTIAN